MAYRKQPGYFRTSKNGVVHWVSGSEQYVDTPTPYELMIERYPEIHSTGGATFRYFKPNATCPVCGKPVFFYQNEHGSRVYFDELGPPWPKHPCLISEDLHAKDGASYPFERLPGQALEIDDGLRFQNRNLEDLFTERYGCRPWGLAEVEDIFEHEGRPVLELKRISWDVKDKIYVSRATFPSSCVKGTLVAVNGNWISYLDKSDFREVRLEIELMPEDVGISWDRIFKMMDDWD